MNGPLWPEGTGRERENLGNFDQQLVNLLLNAVTTQVVNENQSVEKKRSTSNFDVRTSYQVAIWNVYVSSSGYYFVQQYLHLVPRFDEVRGPWKRGWQQFF